MGGPIVRTGTTPKFWENWDRVFGDQTKKKKASKTSKSKKKTAKKTKK
jgi:hypothetical protein